MPYCSDCGNPYQEGSTKFCPKCGAVIPIRSRGRSLGPGFVLAGSVLLVAVLVAPFAFRWLLGECGALHLDRAFREFATYEQLMIDFETTAETNARPPAFLVSQLYGATKGLANRSFDTCFQPAADAMRAALLHAGAYYDYYSQESGNPKARWERDQLEIELRNYYSQINELRACHPFCNAEEVFRLRTEVANPR